MQKFFTAAIAALILGTSLASPTAALARPGHHGVILRPGANASGMHHFAGGWQHRQGFGSGNGYYGHPGYGNGYGYGYGYDYDEGYDPGAAIAGGIIGLAAGAMLGGALMPSSSARWCEAHYRSYDPGSRSFLGNDGMRHPCPAR